jgi:hypothetical protein
VSPVPADAIAVAGFLAAVVGKAHGRQMDAGTRKEWQRELQRSRSKSLNAPSWLWTSLVELLADHERGYLDHCRQFALEDAYSPTSSALPEIGAPLAKPMVAIANEKDQFALSQRSRPQAVGESNPKIDHADDCVSGNHPMTGAQAPTSKPFGRMLRAGQFLKDPPRLKRCPQVEARTGATPVTRNEPRVRQRRRERQGRTS